jgi:SAM-dependent methyltransferase
MNQEPDTDAAAPLVEVSPAEATAAAFDALGSEYERAFHGVAGLDAAVDRLLGTLGPGSRVLDVGSGTGRPVAARLAAAGHRVTGLDVSPRMVELARAQVPEASFELADVRTWPCPARSWDAICAFFSLLTMPRHELDATLARLAAWLVPGGRLALATVPADVDGVAITFLGQPVTASSYPVATLLERLRSVGVEIESWHEDTFRPDHPGATEEPHLFVGGRRPCEH